MTPFGPEAAALLTVLDRDARAPGPTWDEKAFHDLLSMPGTFALVEEREGSPAAFGLFRQAADEMEVIMIATLVGHRRKGLAAKVLRGAFGQAIKAGCTSLFLEVAEDNQPAQALYENCGFRVVGRRKDYYPGPKDALVLERRIGS